MNQEELLKKMNNGEMFINEPQSPYVECEVTIKNASAEVTGKTKIVHPLLQSQNTAAGTVFLVVSMDIQHPDLTSPIEHIEVGNLFSTKGTLAIYPTYENASGQKKPGTLLYDILTLAKEYSPEQNQKLSEKAGFVPSMLKGLRFKIPAKFVSTDKGSFFVLLTSRQKLKDDLYRESKQSESQHDESTEELQNDIDNDSMPF